LVSPAPAEVATARWHFAPGLRLVNERTGTWLALEGERALARLEVVVGQARLVSTLHAQRFGQVVEAPTLDIILVNGLAAARLTWIA